MTISGRVLSTFQGETSLTTGRVSLLSVRIETKHWRKTQKNPTTKIQTRFPIAKRIMRELKRNKGNRVLRNKSNNLSIRKGS
jgi:hypothetical protein